MQTHVNANEQVRQIAELVPAKGCHKENSKYCREGVFQQPIGHVCGADERAGPYKYKDRQERHYPPVLFEWRPMAGYRYGESHDLFVFCTKCKNNQNETKTKPISVHDHVY